MASSYSIFPPLAIRYYSTKVVCLAPPASVTAAFDVNFKRQYPCERKAVSFTLLRKKWMLSSTSSISVVDLADDEVNNWDLCRQALSCFNFDTEEIDKILGKAFGRIHSPYWGEERAKEVPRSESVTDILNYLRSLTLTNEDLAKILKKFPEVLGCNLNDEVMNNVMVLEKEWGITGKSLRNLLLRNPKVLGYNVDCKGSCVAQCTRCWVRF